MQGRLDVLRAIEDVEGGPGADAPIGDRGANKLSGGGGRDRLEGGAGADDLDGGAGADTLLGAAGGDRLSAGEQMSGGSGDDRIFAVDPFLPAVAGPAPRIHAGAGDDTISLAIVPEALDCGRGLDLHVDISPDLSVSLAGLDVEPCERIVIANDALAVDVSPLLAQRARSRPSLSGHRQEQVLG